MFHGSKKLKILGFSHFVLLLMLSSGCASMAADEREKSEHFKQGVFKNQDDGMPRSFWDFIKTRIKTSYADWPEWVESEYGNKPIERVMGDEIRVTHINHSTVLIQTAGFNILTDPTYSNRASPVSFAGPKRVRNPGIRFEDLPKIDVVLISHDHYDHLDLPTIERLQQRDHPHIFLGLGVGKRLDSTQNVHELDWWQQVELEQNLNVHFVPVQHFSGRTLFDRNSTLWGGFVVETGKHKIYFGGDSGYGTHYQQTFERFGAMDLSIIPMGGYAPRSFMGYVHLDPRQAVQAHKDLHSQKTVGIHFGTFQLTAESINEPIELLKTEGALAGLEQDTFVTLVFGVPLILK